MFYPFSKGKNILKAFKAVSAKPVSQFCNQTVASFKQRRYQDFEFPICYRDHEVDAFLITLISFTGLVKVLYLLFLCTKLPGTCVRNSQGPVCGTPRDLYMELPRICVWSSKGSGKIEILRRIPKITCNYLRDSQGSCCGNIKDMCMEIPGICVQNFQGSVYVTPKDLCAELPGISVRNFQGSVVGSSNKQGSLLY